MIALRITTTGALFMPLTYGPTLLDVRPVSASDVTVTTWDNKPVALTTAVSVDASGAVAFEVPSSNRYRIKIKTRYGTSITPVNLQATEPPVSSPVVVLTQAAYNALATKNPTTVYVIGG